jgi:hypothetical protein
MSEVSTSPNAKQISRQLWERKHDLEKRTKFLITQRKAVKALRTKNREIVYSHYGGICKHCDEADWSVLTLDHINEDGHKYGPHGKRSNRRDQCYLAIKGGLPDDLQLLCFVCNQLKHVAHTGVSSKPSALEYQKLRRDVIGGYGGRCPCGEDRLDALTIDHVNHDGSKDRAEVGTVKIYRRLRRENFPSGYQVLCLNCNWRRFLTKHSGGVLIALLLLMILSSHSPSSFSKHSHSSCSRRPIAC